jgi:hypothetical protein
MVYGSKWTDLIAKKMKHFSKLGIDKMLFVTLGEEAKKVCTEISIQVECLEFPSLHNSQIHRYTAAHVFVYLGFDVFYFDLDTFFFQSPFKALGESLRSEGIPLNTRSQLEEKKLPSFLISSHADGNCVNVGFFYVMAERASAEFFTRFIDWYHRHPFEIDQRGMDAFLGHSKTIGASFIPERIRGGADELIMHYAILDDVNRFVIPGVGWYGQAEELVVAHYCEWEMERKLEDLNFLYSKAESIPSGSRVIDQVEEIRAFFDKYRVLQARERTECW